jgi:hypothetical protein
MLLMKYAAFAILVLTALPAVAASRPASRPVDSLAGVARDAVKNHSLPGFAADVERQLRPQLEKTTDPDAAEIIRLAAWRQFARYFARVNNLTDGQQDTLAWLVDHAEVREALMTAVTTSDPPNRVLEVLRALRADHRQRVEEFPELAAAVCVVWDAHERFGGNPMADDEARIDPGEPSRVFGYFVRNADRLAFDPRRTPAELLGYVVDTHLGPQEIEWAGRYGGGGRPNVAAAFFAVPFREGVAYERNAPPPPDPNAVAAAPGENATPEFELNKNSYILPNILRRGGSVHDAAYFAAEVARAGGVPAAVCVSTVDAPDAAWCGFLPAARAGNRRGTRPPPATRSTSRGSDSPRIRRRTSGAARRS